MSNTKDEAAARKALLRARAVEVSNAWVDLNKELEALPETSATFERAIELQGQIETLLDELRRIGKEYSARSEQQQRRQS